MGYHSHALGLQSRNAGLHRLEYQYATSVCGSPDSARDWIYGSPGERVFVGFESYDQREATAG
jgi:hypothetical protein